MTSLICAIKHSLSPAGGGEGDFSLHALLSFATIAAVISRVPALPPKSRVTCFCSCSTAVSARSMRST